MSGPPKKSKSSFFTGLPDFASISHEQSDLSPSSYNVPKDLTLVGDNYVQQIIVDHLKSQEAIDRLTLCAEKYVPKSELEEDAQDTPFSFTNVYTGIELNDGQCKTATNLLGVSLRLRQQYCAKSFQGFYPLLSQILVQRFGGFEGQNECNTLINPENVMFDMKNGVTTIYKNAADLAANKPLNLGTPTLEDFVTHIKYLTSVAANPETIVYCENRLRKLSNNYQQNVRESGQQEEKEIQQNLKHRSFDTVTKMETHLHAGTILQRNLLLEEFKEKLTSEEKTIVTDDSRSLHDLMADTLGVTEVKPDELFTEDLDPNPELEMYRNFENFNLRSLPCGKTDVKKVFYKVENVIQGRFFADILKKAIANMKKNKTQWAEIRISLSGANLNEITKIATWWSENKLHDDRVRWIIQIPRKFAKLESDGKVKSFHEMMTNIFLTMFEASKRPENHLALDAFLSKVVGFDLVDNEEVEEYPMFEETVTGPEAWKKDGDPPYNYYLYHVFMNVAHLNHYRCWKKQNTFTLRLHSGEAGALHHLIGAFLMGESICHGLKIIKSPVIQYLYLLSQIGISTSPTSNHILFKEYHNQPLKIYIERGLCVCVSSDDPFVFSDGQQPLVDEIKTVKREFKLTRTEVLELCQNAILICGFPHTLKNAWIGPLNNYDTKKEDQDYLVPTTRLNFRLLSQILPELAEVFNAHK